MAKARQNLKRRIYSSTVFEPLTEENAQKRNRLMDRRNTSKAGVSAASLSREENVVVKVDDNGEVAHEHGPNCAHDRE